MADDLTKLEWTRHSPTGRVKVSPRPPLVHSQCGQDTTRHVTNVHALRLWTLFAPPACGRDFQHRALKHTLVQRPERRLPSPSCCAPPALRQIIAAEAHPIDKLCSLVYTLVEALPCVQQLHRTLHIRGKLQRQHEFPCRCARAATRCGCRAARLRRSSLCATSMPGWLYLDSGRRLHRE